MRVETDTPTFLDPPDHRRPHPGLPLPLAAAGAAAEVHAAARMAAAGPFSRFNVPRSPFSTPPRPPTLHFAGAAPPQPWPSGAPRAAARHLRHRPHPLLQAARPPPPQIWAGFAVSCGRRPPHRRAMWSSPNSSPRAAAWMAAWQRWRGGPSFLLPQIWAEASLLVTGGRRPLPPTPHSPQLAVPDWGRGDLVGVPFSVLPVNGGGLRCALLPLRRLLTAVCR